jgi:hypothetical protein
MSDWRKNIEILMEYLEADDASNDMRSLAELIYFIGEVESDGFLGYFDRHDASEIKQLGRATRVIESAELASLLSAVTEQIGSLPIANTIADRVSLFLDQANEDPFSHLELHFQSILPEIENQIDKRVATLDY